MLLKQVTLFQKTNLESLICISDRYASYFQLQGYWYHITEIRPSLRAFAKLKRNDLYLWSCHPTPIFLNKPTRENNYQISNKPTLPNPKPTTQLTTKCKTLIYSVAFKRCGRSASNNLTSLLPYFDLKLKERVLHYHVFDKLIDLVFMFVLTHYRLS